MITRRNEQNQVARHYDQVIQRIRKAHRACVAIAVLSGIVWVLASPAPQATLGLFLTGVVVLGMTLGGGLSLTLPIVWVLFARERKKRMRDLH
jgi:predicted neutral ceramidase superfamily lipid hydrolase